MHLACQPESPWLQSFRAAAPAAEAVLLMGLRQAPLGPERPAGVRRFVARLRFGFSDLRENLRRISISDSTKRRRVAYPSSPQARV